MSSESGEREPPPQSIEERETEARIRKLLVETRVLEERLAFEQRAMEERRPLEATEAAARIEKLAIEKRTLGDQLAHGYKLREWLKAGTGAAAILTLVWTAAIGFQQLRDNLAAREQERLERAVVRLVSDKVPERLSGVTLLRTFLAKAAHGPLALAYLSNTMVGETDSAVREAILGAISSVNPEHIDEPTRNEALAALVSGNRILTQRVMSSRHERRFLLIDARADSGDAGRLRSISRAMVSLLGKGARVKDMSGVYCAGCDLRGMELPETIFDQSFLAGANFEKAHLAKASFEGALLARTRFTETNLQDARFTLTRGRGFAVDIWQEGGIDTIGGPSFKCADLRRANFTGQPFFGFIEDAADFIAPINATVTEFTNANLEQADFKNMGVYVVLPLEDARLTTEKFPPSPKGGLPPDLDSFKRLSDFPLPLGPMGAALGKTFEGPGYAIFFGRVDERFSPGSAPPKKGTNKYSQNLHFLTVAFAHSNWTQATLPDALRQILVQRNVPSVRKGDCAPDLGRN